MTKFDLNVDIGDQIDTLFVFCQGFCWLKHLFNTNRGTIESIKNCESRVLAQGSKHNFGKESIKHSGFITSLLLFANAGTVNMNRVSFIAAPRSELNYLNSPSSTRNFWRKLHMTPKHQLISSRSSAGIEKYP